jgi:DNA-binding transcriptional MerR regulator
MAANRPASKSAAAFRTISEVSDELEVPQHVLRFWETKFTQVRPMKRGGGRRYYRPEDIELLRRIRDLLYSDGYTIKGVQKLLREGQVKPPAHEEAVAEQERAGAPPPVGGSALEADTAPEATAAAQAGGSQAPGGPAAGLSGPAQQGAAQQGVAQHGPSGRASGPASRAATATTGSGGRASESAAPAAPQGEGGARGAPRQAPRPSLTRAQREAIETTLDELRAARAELKRRTGQ